MKHYTAGVSLIGTCRWGNSPDNRNSSFPFVIGDRVLPGLPAMPDTVAPYLPVTALMLSDLRYGHWHGNWANSLTAGTENRNAGPLQKKDGKFYWWRGEYDPEKMGKDPVLVGGQWWEPYTAPQLVANIWLTRMLVARFRDDEHPLDPRWILPHSAVKSTKLDTGRAFPMNAVRTVSIASYGDDHTPPIDPWELGFVKKYKKAPTDTILHLEDVEEQAYMDAMSCRALNDRDEGPILPPDSTGLVEPGPWREKLLDVGLALSELGYYVHMKHPDDFSESLESAVWIFQTSTGSLKANSVPGSKTRKALRRRLKQFGLED